MSLSEEHEIPLELIRNRPDFARMVAVEVFGLDFPDDLTWRLGPETITNLAPRESRLDVSLIGEDAENPRRCLIHEVQLTASRKDLARIDKSWPCYVTNLRARFDCPATLLAFCPTETIARKVAKKIDCGHPGFVLGPLVYTPADLKPITDLAKAREMPEWVFLSAAAHADGPDGPKTLEAVAAALQVTDDSKAVAYYDYVLSQLTKSARQILEELMASPTFRPKSDWGRRLWTEGEAHGEVKGKREGKAEGRREGRLEGKLEGEAEAVFAVFKARRITVGSHVEARIRKCTDPKQLLEWVERAAIVDRAEDIFA
ncbi:hypothetical protein [Actinomadura gamaensis]|uniref:DUF4351 domain-containing protein n=1 Tax=Actinomadura gamaensis TaxID=1763541 RepID=A0ABV9TX50_9ACTN